MTTAELQFGCMGFSYKEWVGPFYAPGTQAKDMLRGYAACFSTVELDTTFYAPPPESTVRKWLEVTPAGFTFAAKVWQRITHERRFEDCAGEMAVFLNAVEPLEERLGPLLIQCPPDLTIEALPAFKAFVRALPRRFRWAVEFRHRSWLVPEVADLLNAENICLVGADLYYMPVELPRTADFIYVRLLGNRRQIASIGSVVRDRGADIRAWAARLSDALPDADAGWVFANNHYSGFSPHTVTLFLEALGLARPVFPRKAAPAPGSVQLNLAL